MRTMPLILEVNPERHSMKADLEFLGKLGHPVVGCCGPGEEGGCPLLRGESCPKIEDADGVIFRLNLDSPEHRRLLSYYIRYFDALEVPIRAVVTPEQKAKYSKLLSMVEVWTHPVSGGMLDGFSAEVESGWAQAPHPRPSSQR